ncbi:hypothetical protein [Mesobacillus jeotgali]|uniref:hypothetical protein n=1 Tax=Mesobacillus jeotgali TaxID=129985 RepID=UPI0011169D1D|nr:hypothetical protein [Mesobacillus jeotgali]
MNVDIIGALGIQVQEKEVTNRSIGIPKSKIRETYIPLLLIRKRYRISSATNPSNLTNYWAS